MGLVAAVLHACPIQRTRNNGRNTWRRCLLDRPAVGYKTPNGQDQLISVEAESNTSTIALRVVGGDKKGSHKSETVKYGREFHGTQTRE
jgi:hypothetical protein